MPASLWGTRLRIMDVDPGEGMDHREAPENEQVLAQLRARWTDELQTGILKWNRAHFGKHGIPCK
ncbi:MAG: hypothetical protein M1835_006780 [Candelina submexicana]|nr:MAG: hypothetical protein M1835_006780 [Candelina submexicana]